ncbi:MAG: putative ABC transporter permease subunit [Deltaproteobacteria bacterium]
MRSFWALLKILLINYFGLSLRQVKDPANRREYFKKFGLGVIIVVALAPTIFLYIRMLIQGYDVLAPLGQEGAILTLGLVLVSALVFFFGVFYVVSFFYFATDAESLLALPLRAWQVLGARFCLLLCYEYLTALPFLLPPLIVYGVKAGAGLSYWIIACLGFFMVPVLPLSLAAIPTIVVMRFANLSRRKDLFKIIGSMLVIALVIAYQFLFQNTAPNSMDPEFLQRLFTERTGLMNYLSRVFPSTRYLGLALINAGNSAGLLNLLLFAAISLAALILAWFTGEKLYYRGLIGSSETSARRKALNHEDYRRLERSSPAVLTYFIKEVRILLRTPTYFMNSVMTNLLAPVLVLLPFYFQSRRGITMPWSGLMNNLNGQRILLVAVVSIILFMVGSNAMTATAISREGKEFYISRFIPLSYQQQINAKMLSAYIFGIIGAFLMIAASRILIPESPLFMSLMLGVSLVAIIPVIEAGMLLDILRPKLEWENEQQAFKQNLNVMFSMLFALLIAGAAAYFVINYFHSPLSAALFMVVCFTLLAVLLYYLLMTWGIRRYHELQG